MTRRKKPSAPRKIAAPANDDGQLIANDCPAVKEGPSARILRQMLRAAHAPKVPAPEPVFHWSESQLTRLRRAEAKKLSPDKRAQANGVAEIARLTAERATAIARIQREADETETLGLAILRNEDIDAPPAKPGELAKPMVRRSGLDWLRRKGRITVDQHIAGQRYADDFRVSTDISLRSCLSDVVGSGEGLSGMESREEAFLRLRAAREDALSGHAKMIGLCDQVCGEGKTIRQLAGDNEAEAQQCESALLIALDLLGLHYGTNRKCVQTMSI